MDKGPFYLDKDEANSILKEQHKLAGSSYNLSCDTTKFNRFETIGLMAVKCIS